MSKSKEVDFKFGALEEYFGDTKQVQKQIDECKVCGGKLIFTHLSDYKNLYVQETARCPECGAGNKAYPRSQLNSASLEVLLSIFFATFMADIKFSHNLIFTKLSQFFSAHFQSTQYFRFNS